MKLINKKINGFVEVQRGHQLNLMSPVRTLNIKIEQEIFSIRTRLNNKINFLFNLINNNLKEITEL